MISQAAAGYSSLILGLRCEVRGNHAFAKLIASFSCFRSWGRAGRLSLLSGNMAFVKGRLSLSYGVAVLISCLIELEGAYTLTLYDFVKCWDDSKPLIGYIENGRIFLLEDAPCIFICQ